MSSRIEEKLVLAAREGDRDAYASLVNRYQKRIKTLCWLRLGWTGLGGQGAHEDVAQETFLRALRGLDRLEDPRKFGAWLRGIAERLCTDVLRSNKRKAMASLEEMEFEGLPVAVSLDDDRKERFEKLWLAMRTLPEEYRDVLFLFYYAGNSYREIGQLLGVAEATVNVRMTKARKQLRSGLERGRDDG